MNYQMTPISAGTRLRIDHNTFAKVITSYGTTPTTTAYGAILSGSSTINIYKDPATVWTASGGKRIFALRLWYQIS